MLKSVIFKTVNVQKPGGTVFDHLTANSLKSLRVYCMLQRSISTLLLHQKKGVNNELLLRESCTSIWNQIAKLTIFYLLFYNSGVQTKRIYLAFLQSSFDCVKRTSIALPTPHLRVLCAIFLKQLVSILHILTQWKIQWVSFLPPTTGLPALAFTSGLILVNRTHFSSHSTSGLTLSWPPSIVLHFPLLAES